MGLMLWMCYFHNASKAMSTKHSNFVLLVACVARSCRAPIVRCEKCAHVTFGYTAQWLERLTADQQVPGSNPSVPYCQLIIATTIRVIAVSIAMITIVGIHHPSFALFAVLRHSQNPRTPFPLANLA
jgi:type IV secretory pathway TraG/TraD family ATPase VirD4